MAYAEGEPPASLRAAVVCLWRRDAEPDPTPSLILPDGCVDLIWQSGRGVFLAGPDTRPVTADQRPGHILRGVRLQPGAGGPVLGLPLDPLRNLRVDLADLHPSAARHVHGDLHPDEALRRLVALTGSFAEQRPPDPVLLAAARLLDDPAARVHELGTHLDLSERQLRRRFTAAVGYGPKTLHRVLRFRRFLTMLDASPATGLAELAVRAGYADQAHLTRDAVQLAGRPPAALARMRKTRGHD
ncbi:helix-turn-helix domain-containing protein [Actinoplanes derwentensis]|uniref:AraC-type DNA-binding protein n=1 Tax=Actinoplanes derwentensis TaxID=113562 RepID=A0A1H1T9X2_9ACTN|nr:helix-turn-helix domain-containing protein [Actinoplanes derwentensis]GID89023.1 AraC family transcriptional regulator [Actinoplanes derwentensis]SDS56816.1 AraC-type DNA-binding protein [Actinoplanes derwentensis]